jgi:hypothetical protein
MRVLAVLGVGRLQRRVCVLSTITKRAGYSELGRYLEKNEIGYHE